MVSVVHVANLDDADKPTLPSKRDAYAALSRFSASHNAAFGSPALGLKEAEFEMRPPVDKEMATRWSLLLQGDRIVGVMTVRLQTATGRGLLRIFADPTDTDLYRDVCCKAVELARPFLDEIAETKVKAGTPVLFSVGLVSEQDFGLIRILEQEGFTSTRSFKTMLRNFVNDEDSMARLSKESLSLLNSLGFEIRPYDADLHAHALHVANETAFKGHFGHVRTVPFDIWFDDTHNLGDGFSPSLFTICWNTTTNTCVGAVLSYNWRNVGGTASIYQVFVDKALRGKGVGKALLLIAFESLRNAGFDSVRLYVDAENGTNAVELYKAVGMSCFRTESYFRKIIRGNPSLVVDC
ncbi:acyl-CoA N-acyltransferase [Chytriomyces sp. MP71]|nr:acyl-CoA N-acyltransferase [Chytriomyces sp. MP71]